MRMPGSSRPHLERLIGRWRLRHEARLDASPRPPADEDREARADTLFPWRAESPAAYAARHGAAMTGYTYDAYSYRDPALEAWLRELGEILRRRRQRS
jgi:hypothetical protein